MKSLFHQNAHNKCKKWPMIGSLFLGVVFCFASISKLIFIYDFRGTIDVLLVQFLGKTTLPIGLIRDGITITLPGIELSLGLSLLLFAKRPRLPAFFASILLGLFTLILVFLLTMNRPPRCGCFGSWNLLRVSAQSGAALGIVRNTGLLLLSLWLARIPRHTFKKQKIAAIAYSRGGFTIIELLVVIGIIALLLAILLPALGKVKEQSITARTLSAMRQSNAAITQYANEEQDFLPYMGTPGHPEDGIWPDADWGDWGPPSYFKGQSALWPTVLLEHGIDLTGISPEIYRPDSGPARIYTYYWLTSSAHARPEFWVGIDPPLDSSNLYKGVRMGEAVYPSNKGLLVDVGHLNEKSTNWAVSFFDGSAVLKSTSNPSVYADIIRFGTYPYRVTVTEDGIRGRDY